MMVVQHKEQRRLSKRKRAKLGSVDAQVPQVRSGSLRVLGHPITQADPLRSDGFFEGDEGEAR